jgi:hypothetical protein
VLRIQIGSASTPKLAYIFGGIDETSFVMSNPAIFSTGGRLWGFAGQSPHQRRHQLPLLSTDFGFRYCTRDLRIARFCLTRRMPRLSDIGEAVTRLEERQCAGSRLTFRVRSADFLSWLYLIKKRSRWLSRHV